MTTPLLAPVLLDETTEYDVLPAQRHVVNLGTHATLEFWNGAEWKPFPSASGGATQDKDFVFDAPASGKIRVVIAAGQSAVAGFYPQD